MVLAFHGRGADFEATFGLLPISDHEGFLLVSPDGTGSPRGCVRPVSSIQITAGGHEWPGDADLKMPETVWTFLKDQSIP